MSVLWYMAVLVALMVAQAKFYEVVVLKKLTYTRSFAQHGVFEGEKTELVEVLENHKLTPVSWLRVEARISPWLRFKKQENLDINMEQFHRSVFFLNGYSKLTRRHEVTCAHRGYYRFNQTALTGGDLLGLSQKTVDIFEQAELYVYPRVSTDGELPPQALKWQGEISAQRWILPDPMLINGIREYRGGDSRKDIHWRATARTGKLEVKTRDFSVSPRLMVALNAQIAEDLWAMMDAEQCAVIEEGIRHAAAILSWAVQQGMEAGFLYNGRLCDAEGETVYVHPAASESHLVTLLETLAKLVVIRQLNFHSLLDRYADDNMSGMDIVVISAYWSDALEACADRLRRNGNSVSYIPIQGGMRP